MPTTFSRSISYIARVLVLLGLAAQAQAQSISTPAPQRQIGMLNNTGNQTMGQSLLAPTSTNSLDSFSFFLNAHGDPAAFNSNLQFHAYLMQWDIAAERAVGGVLWKSGQQSGPTSTMQRYDFLTGGVATSAGQAYILFLSTSEVLSSMVGGSYGVLMGYGYNDYSSGRFYSATTLGDFNSLTSNAWTRDAGCGDCDASFVANFSYKDPVVTPEPASLALLATGLGGIALLRRRQRRT